MKKYGSVVFQSNPEERCYYVVSNTEENITPLDYSSALENYNLKIKECGIASNVKILVEIPIETCIVSEIKNGGTWIGGVKVCQEELESKSQFVANSERK